MIAWNAYHLRDDRQLAESCVNVVEGHQNFCAPSNASRFDAAHVAVNFCAWGQIDTSTGLQRLDSPHYKFGILFCALGSEVLLQNHEEFRSRGDRIGLRRQTMPTPIRLLRFRRRLPIVLLKRLPNFLRACAAARKREQYP